MLVKICGIKTLEAAQEAVEHGANLIGMIMVPGRDRTVDLDVAADIVKYVHSVTRSVPLSNESKAQESPNEWSKRAAELEKATAIKPQVVGVFKGQSLDDVLALQKQLGLDIVQFHGNEPLEWCKEVPVPVFKRFTPGKPGFENTLAPNAHFLPLIDGEVGGDGRLVDWKACKSLADDGVYLLAGGLTPENVQDALAQPGVAGVDVSGGVETSGKKDPLKIRAFLHNAGKLP